MFNFLVFPKVRCQLSGLTFRKFVTGAQTLQRLPGSSGWLTFSSSAGGSSFRQVRIAASVPTVRICSSCGRETGGVGLTGTVGSSVTVGKACELGQIARLVLHGFMLRSGLGAPAVQLLTAALLFCSVRGDSCLSEWGIHRPFSTPAPEKVCCGSSSSESSWRERQIGGTTGSRTFESQALESIRFLTHPAPGQRVFSFQTGPSDGVRDLTGRDSSSIAPTGAQVWWATSPF